MEKIKVKIIKNSGIGSWCNNKIGDEYEVIDYTDVYYKKVGSFDFIAKEDCEVIESIADKKSCNDYMIYWSDDYLKELSTKLCRHNFITVNNFASVTMSFEETITFTEDEQFDIQLLDEMLNHLIK